MKAAGLNSVVHILLIGVMFAGVSAIAVAQGAQKQSQAGSAVAESTLRGCLQPGKDHTTLTDTTGTTYLLKGKIGPVGENREYVEVLGQQLAPISGQGEAAMPRIEVKTLRKLADTCPADITPPPARTPVYNPTAPRQSPTTPPYDGPATAPAQEGAPVINTPGAGGAPSPGTGNPPPPQQR